jgi:hypothetical protein
MKNGRFHPSKCRGKVQKMEVLYTRSSKMRGPTPNFLITPKKSKNQKIAKKEGQLGSSMQPIRLWAVANRRSLVAHLSCMGALNSPLPKFSFFFLSTFFCTCGHLLLVGSSTCPPCPDFS